MARFFTLASGSSGNCTYIGSASRGILVDAGISCKAIRMALSTYDLDFSNIDAIFITHEHTDHIKGLAVLTKHCRAAVYASEGTLRYLEAHNHLAPGTSAYPIKGPVSAADIAVTAFRTAHDSAESVGFRIHTADDRLIGVATDLGTVTGEVKDGLRGCELVMLESNYDQRMLQNGPYPYYLKRRIAGQNGHLCNDDCAVLLPELAMDGATRFVLCHLSRDNNMPSLAVMSSKERLLDCGMSEGRDFLLAAAPRFDPGPITIF